MIDTLAQAFKGADENSSVDMGLIIGSAQKLQKIIEDEKDHRSAVTLDNESIDSL